LEAEMSTQSVVHPVKPSKFSVVFPARPDSQTITQTELVLYLSLKGRLEQLQEQVAAAEAELKGRLEAGAIVQPGDHIARIDERSRRNVAWRKVSEDLADTVFGDGKGAAYCDEVLASTEPTITTNLVIR
jgi:hypothetical protein